MADTIMAPRLSEVTGVGHVSVQGGISPAIRIQADLSRLAAYGIALEDLRTAIVGANVAGPKGSLDGAHQSYTIAANDQIDQRRRLQVGGGGLSQRRAGAASATSPTCSTGWRTTRSAPGIRASPAIVIDVQRQPGANVIETVQRVRAELPRLRRAMPAGGASHHRQRPHRHHPRLDPRRAVHLGAQHRAGGAGGACLPAHDARHHHRRRGAAAVADRDLRRDVVLPASRSTICR